MYNVGDVIEYAGQKYKVVAVAHSPEEKAHLMRTLPRDSYDIILHMSDVEKYFLKKVEEQT